MKYQGTNEVLHWAPILLRSIGTSELVVMRTVKQGHTR